MPAPVVDGQIPRGKPETGLRFLPDQFRLLRHGHGPFQGGEDPWQQVARAGTDPAQGGYQIGRPPGHGVAAIETQANAGPPNPRPSQSESREKACQLAPLPIPPLEQEVVGPFESPLQAQGLQLVEKTHGHTQAWSGRPGFLRSPGEGGAEPDPPRGRLPEATVLAVAKPLVTGQHGVGSHQPQGAPSRALGQQALQFRFRAGTHR